MKSGVDTSEFTMVRVFDAPRELVWDVWTRPEHAVRWWGPRGCSTPVFQSDLRPGGTFLIDVLMPDGSIYRNTGVYEDVVVPERLSHVNSVELGGVTLLEARTTVTFEDLGGKTKITVHQTYLKVSDEGVYAPDGALEGWKQHLDRLGEYVETRAS